MATVIFKWNPAFSSYTMQGFLGDLTYVKRNGTENGDFDWSVWDYDKIHDGDEFYWVKVGLGQTGILGHGVITSEPREGRDWSGKGRKTFYVDFEPDILINPDALPLLTCRELGEAIPDFEWDKGHSGLVLSESQSERLVELWAAYLEKHKAEFLSKTLKDRDYIFMEDSLEEVALEIATKAHAGQKDKAGKDYIEHPKRVADSCYTTEERVVALLHDTIEDTDVTPDSLREAGMPEEIVEAVLSVTRREGETYEAFVKRASENRIGRVVKLHDLEDNLDIMRLDAVTEKDIERLNRYLKAYRFLKSLIDND